MTRIGVETVGVAIERSDGGATELHRLLNYVSRNTIPFQPWFRAFARMNETGAAFWPDKDEKMAREEFIDSLRVASRFLAPPTVSSDQGANYDAFVGSTLQNADLWFTAKSVEGYNAADFRDWPKAERDLLEKEVAAFLGAAMQVRARRPATRSQSKQARKHLDAIIKIVRDRLLHEWLNAQEKLMTEATKAAETKGWYVNKDEKEILESLLGSYKAPRLRIRTRENEVVLDPIARFGSGRQGIVDLVVMPTYETAYLITFKNGAWQIVSRHGTFHSRPFSQSTLVNTITKLPHP